MKILIYTILITLLSINSFFGQSRKYVEHKVITGENVTQIATKYNVTPALIYSLNPDSQNGIKAGMTLLIPKSAIVINNSNVKKTALKTILHKVASGETMYSIAKMYGITEVDLGKSNPEVLKNGLKLGQTITVLSSKQIKSDPKKINVKQDFHIVEAKETKYSIAKKYNLTVVDLEKINPNMKGNDLQEGTIIKINPEAKNSKTAEDIKKIKKAKVENIEKPMPINIPLKDYEVKSKETLYGISKKTGLSEDQLIRLNPDLKDGLKEGMILKLPLQINTNEQISATGTHEVNLLKNISVGKKKMLALLLPFNASKISKDSLNSVGLKIKKDKFLNMTLDFYSGVQIAIDSAKTLGLNLDIKILDSQETKNSSNAANLISENGLEKSDVIIGPFYQSNVEKTAELLVNSDTYIISPLSKENGKQFKNMLQSMPNNEVIKSAMFDYMHAKNGNILAIIDIKKGAYKKYIIENHNDTKIVVQDEKGDFTVNNIIEQLVSDKINYVILESEKTNTILKTLNLLIGLSANYQIQLVILEKNPTLDFEEIPISKLTKLRLMFPSLSKENETIEGLQFERKYKKKYKTIPNQYAIRGFDVTFDTILRLSQSDSFIETIQNQQSFAFENKFDYQKEISGAYQNKGVYILYYDTDLSVKEAN